MKKTKKENKIGTKRICSNVLYVLRYIYHHDKQLAVSYLISRWSLDCIGTVINTYVFKCIIDSLSSGADFHQILKLLFLQALLFSVQIVLHIVFKSIFNIRLVKVTGIIQRELMEKAQKMDLRCYDIPEYYDDFVIAASQSERMLNYSIWSISFISSSILCTLIAGSMIFFINPIIAIFPVAGFIINIVTRLSIIKLEYLYEIEKTKIERKADYSKRVFYQPEYAKEIKFSGIKDALIEQFDEAVNEEKEMAKKYGFKIALLSFINWVCVFTLLQYFAVPVFLGYLALKKQVIGLGDVASLKNASNEIQNHLDTMNYCISDFQRVGQSAERFRRFMDYEINIEEFQGTEPLPAQDCSLELKNVGFKYKDSENYVLKNISLTVHKGEKLALVGENGAGKSTLIKLIMRLYDVTEGSILYGGVDIRKLNTREYRKKIGAVFQDFQIYGATLAENVATDFFQEDDKEKVYSALQRADFGKRLEELPKGIDTEMTREFSDCGVMLSGGEAQKVAIARMFMRDIPIAILDEPSSALDPIAEYRLNKSMMQNAKNQAVILISHRLSTTKDADRIILLENGNIVENGTHQQLLEKDGKYAQMWKVQSEKYCHNIFGDLSFEQNVKERL